MIPFRELLSRSFLITFRELELGDGEEVLDVCSPPLLSYPAAGVGLEVGLDGPHGRPPPVLHHYREVRQLRLGSDHIGMKVEQEKESILLGF